MAHTITWITADELTAGSYIHKDATKTYVKTIEVSEHGAHLLNVLYTNGHRELMRADAQVPAIYVAA